METNDKFLKVKVQQRNINYWAGVFLVFLGILATLAPMPATIGFAVIFGAFLFFSGLTQIVFMIFHPEESNTSNWISGLCYLTAGFIFFAFVKPGAYIITVAAASILFLSGIYKLRFAIKNNHTNKPWVLAASVSTLILASVLIWGVETVGIQILGIVLGVDLVILGAYFIFGLEGNDSTQSSDSEFHSTLQR